MVRKSDKKDEVRVSLLPGSEHEYTGRLPWLRRVLLIVLIVLMGATIVSTWYLHARTRAQQERSATRTGELNALARELSAIEGEIAKIGNVGQRIGFAKSILQAHQAAEHMLVLLQETTVPEVSFTQLAADANGSLALSGQARDFQSMVRQLLVWYADPRISDARVSGVTVASDKSGNVEGIDFSVTLLFDVKILAWEPT